MFTVFNRIICVAILAAVSISAKGGGMEYTAKVDFYGHVLTFKYDNQLLYAYKNAASVSEKSIEANLTYIKATNLCDIVVYINEYASHYQLDDIAYVQLTKALVYQTFKSKTANFKQLVLWSLLDEKGYDVVIGYHNNVINTYGLTDEKILGTPFVKQNDKRYYDLDFKEDRNRSLTKIYKGHERREENKRGIKISCFSPPKFTKGISNKNYHFNYGNGSYSIQGRINQTITKYYKDLPIIGIGKVYVNSGFSQQARETVVYQLKKIVAGKNTFEQLNILLKFCQQAIPYKSDQDFLGYEHYSFPEETLLNQFSDCEDKGLLYATLVKEILNIEAVAIYYKELEHVNIALKMPSVIDNYSFMYKGDPYVICEPSSKGLRVGETYQEYVNALTADKVIPLY